VSNRYRDDPVWFTNRHVVENDFIGHFLEHVYTDRFVSHNGILKKHHKKYRNDRYAPAWKTIEFLNFGQTISLYSSIRDADLKKEISMCYGIKKRRIFENYLDTMRFIRNICAHNGVLYDCKTPKEILKIPAMAFDNNDRHGLGACIKVAIWFLGHISQNRAGEMEQGIARLFDSYGKEARSPMAYRILKGRSGICP